MQENQESSEALQEEEPAELTEMFVRRKKTATLGDTLTVQAILCVLLALGFVIVNIVNGSFAAELLDVYESRLDSDGNIFDIIAAVADYLGTAPINNV